MFRCKLCSIKYNPSKVTEDKLFQVVLLTLFQFLSSQFQTRSRAFLSSNGKGGRARKIEQRNPETNYWGAKLKRKYLMHFFNIIFVIYLKKKMVFL